MDVVGLIVIIVVFAVVVLFVKSLEANPEAKGRRGEAKVSAILHSLPSDEYCVLNDIVLDNGSGMSQIDHIVVSLYGIFVIETKTTKDGYLGVRQTHIGHRLSMDISRNFTIRYCRIMVM